MRADTHPAQEAAHGFDGSSECNARGASAPASVQAEIAGTGFYLCVPETVYGQIWEDPEVDLHTAHIALNRLKLAAARA